MTLPSGREAILEGATHPIVELSVAARKPVPSAFGLIKKEAEGVKARRPPSTFHKPVISPELGSGVKV